MSIQMGSRGQDVRDLQLRLRALGYDPGDIDGAFGPHTEAAHQGWVVTQGPGALSSKTWTSRAGHTFPSFHCSSWTSAGLGRAVTARRAAARSRVTMDRKVAVWLDSMISWKI